VKAFRFLEPARLELFDISAHYEEQAVGLGADFLDVISAAISLLREKPELGAPHRSGTRRFVLPRFPYSIIYLDEPEFLIVSAIAHHRRKPGYWTDRL
jgi:toxin ParE1/3/4